MADYDPYFDTAARLLARHVNTLSGRVRSRLVAINKDAPNKRPSQPKIRELINEKFGLIDNQVHKLLSEEGTSPGRGKLDEYLSIAASFETENSPHEWYADSPARRAIWRTVLLDCGAEELRTLAADLHERALSGTLDLLPEVKKALDKAKKEEEQAVSKPVQPPPGGAKNGGAAAAPKPTLFLPDIVDLDCRVLPSNNPDDGQMIAVGVSFPAGAIRISDQGYSLALDSSQMVLDMHEVERIECDGVIQRDAKFDSSKLKMNPVSATARRVAWRLESSISKKRLAGSYQEFVIARAYGPIVPDDHINLFARRGSFKMEIDDTELWPFEDGTQEFKVLEQLIKKHELEPADGYADSYVLATQQLIRSDG